MLLPFTVALLVGLQNPNALQAYERAGALLQDPSFRVFQRWLPPNKRPSPAEALQAEEAREKLLASMTPQERRGAEQDSERLSPDDQELAAHLNELSYLQTRQEELARFQLSLDLLAKAGSQPFSYSPGSSERDQFDVVASVRQLVRLASDAAFVYFAAGQSAKAVETLDEALIMCHRLGQCGIPSRLAAANFSSLILRAFNDNLGSLTLDDSIKVSSVCNALLTDREALASLAKNEKVRLSRWIDGAFGPDGLRSLGKEEDPLARQYAALSPDVRAGFLKRLHAMADERLDSLSQRFDSPEENWLEVSEPAPAQPPDPKSLEELEAALARAFTSGIDHNFMLAVVRSRTQARLLDLHARIVRYRWETGRLPTSLDDLKLPHDALFDPLSHRLFNYERRETGYKLWSVGLPETGIIELNYQPPTDQTAHDPDRP